MSTEDLTVYNGLCNATGKIARTEKATNEWFKVNHTQRGVRAYRCPYGPHFHLTHHKGEIDYTTRRDRKHRKHL